MEEFLKAVNKFLQEERKRVHSNCKSFFVEHKTITPNSTFKAIKEYTITIYIVKQDKNPIPLFTRTHTFNSSKRTPEEVYKELSQDITTFFLKLVRSFEWEKIIVGHFESNTDNGTLN